VHAGSRNAGFDRSELSGILNVRSWCPIYVIRRYVLRLRFRARLLPGLGFTIALTIARCWRWIADTVALVHQPATALAQLSMILRGVPFTVPSQRLVAG